MVKISEFPEDDPTPTAYFPFINLGSPLATRNRRCQLQSIFDLWAEAIDLDNFVVANQPHTFSANQATQVIDLVEEPNIVVPGGSGNYFRLLLTQSGSTLRPPFPLRPGPYLITIKQDEVGGRSLVFDPAYKFTADAEKDLSIAPNAQDVLSCIYDGWSLKAFLARGFEE